MLILKDFLLVVIVMLFTFFVNNAFSQSHNLCNGCHITQNAPASTLTSVNGNANLCISCHNPAGIASAKSFANVMKAEPGVTGTSHRWNMSSVNALFETNKTTDPNMLLRLPGDSVICSTCHNQHNSGFQPNYLRISNTGDALCKNCHIARDIGTYASNPTNKGSHPVGTIYDTLDSRFLTTPTIPIQMVGANVECSSCHGMHYFDSGGANAGAGDGYLLRATNDDNLCQSCHTYTGHKTLGCNTCHQSHNKNKINIYLTQDTINTPNSGNMAVLFTDTIGVNSYADGDSTYDGVCEACHTTTKYHRNNTTGDHTHNVGLNCIKCHLHENNFLHGGGSGDCRECHGHDAGYEYQTGLYCQGKGTVQSHSTHTELDIDDLIGPNISCETCHDTTSFPFFKSGIDGNGDGKYNLSETDVCDNCHSPGGLFDGVSDGIVGAKNNWSIGIYNGNNLRLGKNNWCAGCHDSDRASSNQDGTGIAAPDVAGDSTSYGYYYSGHGKNLIIDCADCHNLRVSHLDGNARTYSYVDSIANLNGTEYRVGYRLNQINGSEPMRIPLNDPIITQLDTANFRLCVNCHSWTNLMDSVSPYATDFNHSGANAPYSFGYGVIAEQNDHLFNHLDFQSHGRVEPYWDSDWDFNTTAIVSGSIVAEKNGYDSYITCVTCHDVHGGQTYGGNTGGNMMSDGRLQGREPGLKFTYLIEATAGLPLVTSVGANKGNSIGGVIRGGVDYRAGYGDAIPQADAICGGCHKEVYPTTDEYNALGNASNGCTPCHPFSTSSNYFMEYYR